MSLKDAAVALPPRPVVTRAAEKNLSSVLEVKGDVAEVTVNLAKDEPEEPEGKARDLLERHGLDPAQFMVTGFRTSTWTMANGEDGTSTRFTFARKGSAAAGGTLLPDIDDLHAAIKRDQRKAPKPKAVAEHVSLLAVIADPQFGKVDERGGTEDTLRRLEASLERFRAHAKKVKPSEIIVIDAGDSIENFESVASEERTNDLSLTEQIRVWRRVFWSWIDEASRLAPSVKVLSVGSNHCRVRRGKNNLGTPSDDYGIEVLTQVADMASVYPEKYSHVEFFAPGRHEESVAIQAVGGKVIGLAHGHQARTPTGLPKWLNGQAAGRTPVGGADIVIAGHFHHYKIEPWGDDRWIFIAPTSDNGSSWYRNVSGIESQPGLLALTIDEEGWRDHRVL